MPAKWLQIGDRRNFGRPQGHHRLLKTEFSAERWRSWGTQGGDTTGSGTCGGIFRYHKWRPRCPPASPIQISQNSPPRRWGCVVGLRQRRSGVAVGRPPTNVVASSQPGADVGVGGRRRCHDRYVTRPYSAILGGLGRFGPLYRRIVFTIDYEGLYDDPCT